VVEQAVHGGQTSARIVHAPTYRITIRPGAAMTAFVYLLASGAAGALASRAWWPDRTDPARTAFLLLGWGLAITWALFGLSLFPGLIILRLPYMAFGSLVPALALYVVDLVFDEGRPSKLVLRVLALSGGVMVLAVGLHGFCYLGTPGASPAQLGLGTYAFAVLVLLLVRLGQVHERTQVRVDQVRLRYLVGVTSGAVVFALVEQLGRVLSPDPSSTLSFAARAVALQGPLPPISVLMGGVALYFLYHTVVSYRLLDLYEVFSRLTALVATALVLVTLDGIAVLWVDTFKDYPLHMAFQAFVASLLFLAMYDPLKRPIEWWANRLLNRRGHQLAEALEACRSEIPKATSKDMLTHMILRRLHGSGRVPVCSIYLWDGVRDAYTLMALRGDVKPEALAALAGPPFTDGFIEGDLEYVRADLTRRAKAGDQPASERLRLMDAMHADVTIPFRQGDVVLGWMHLRDEEWSDGFSVDEVNRLRAVGALASVSLANIQEFQDLEEAHRLAALGAMAAGLAHEIRNPLAGIKGAAQYLQSERLESTSQDMLDVIIMEVDRLNVVVTQFLEYARPFELDRTQDHVNAVVSHVLQLVRAQSLPPGIEVSDDLAGDLPPTLLDRTRMSQVLFNLCHNAVQAMEGTGGRLTVATRRRPIRQGKFALEILVQDTGPGIPPEVQEKLFVPFFTTKEKGTGLGLAISQRIVRAHGGELEMHSVPGRGATFSIVLPMPPETQREPEAQTAEAA
jgi:signal transduction histidine kinase